MTISKLTMTERRRVRASARRFYHDRHGQPITEADVTAHIKTEFGGIMGFIALTIAAQLAWYLIKRWLDRKLDPQDVPAEYQVDEEGYSDGES